MDPALQGVPCGAVGRNTPTGRKRMGLGMLMKTTGREQLDLSLWNLSYLLDPEGTGSSSVSTMILTCHPRHFCWAVGVGLAKAGGFREGRGFQDAGRHGGRGLGYPP